MSTMGEIEMAGADEVVAGVYLVVGSDITSPMDCCVYLIDGGSELAIVDAGAGLSVPQLVSNIESLGFKPQSVAKLILTHCHIDHVGGAARLRQELGAAVLAHRLTARYLEEGDPHMTAAELYGLELSPVTVDTQLSERDQIPVGNLILNSIHTPGHTPDSISLYLDTESDRVLFGQDIHGPLAPEFGSDVGAWRQSMKVLLGLKADVLCEGHFGVCRPTKVVKEYIESYIDYYAGES